MNTKIKLLGATILALGVSVGAAQASTTFKQGTLTVSEYINPALTSFQPSGIYPVDTSLGGANIGKPVTGDFALDANITNTGPAFTAPAGSLNFNVLSTLGFTVGLTGSVGTFTATSVSAVQVLDSTHEVYIVHGTWTVGSDFANAGAIIPNSIEQWTLSLLSGDIAAQGLLTANVPEPSSLSLFGAALFGLGFLQLRKKRKSAFLAS